MNISKILTPFIPLSLKRRGGSKRGLGRYIGLKPLRPDLSGTESDGPSTIGPPTPKHRGGLLMSHRGAKRVSGLWLSLMVASLLLLPVLSACAPAQEVLPAADPTPTPTPPSPPGVYQNSTYGFSLRFPPNWTKTETGQREPAVEIRAPGQFPAIFVSVGYASSLGSPKEQATAIMSSRKESLTNLSIIGEEELALGDAPGYSMEFTWTSRSTPAKGRLVVALRGSQLYQMDIISQTDSYDRLRDSLNSVVASFRLEQAQPFGVPRSQTFTLSDDGPHTLDPALSRELRSHSYVAQVFSGLVTYDKDMNLVPEIAERWATSADGRTYTFFLRRNVKFHNGKALRASDVKYSWERASRPETGSRTADTYLGDIVGVKDMLAGKARELNSVKVIDDYTLEVTIDAPKAYFLAKLFYPVAYVVDRANVESGGKEWWRKPNGAGPFKLRQWLPDELLILERNPDYYREPSTLNYVVFRLFSGIPMMMYETGEIDVVGVGGANIERVRDETNPLSKELAVVPELSLFYMGFNHARPPFDDPLVRRAFAQAIDKNKVVGRSLRDTVQKADGIIPPGMPGFNPNLKPLPFNPAQAKASLAASKYGDASRLPPITLTVSGEGGDLSQGITAIIDQWRVNLGVEVKVRQLEERVFLYNLKKEKDEMFDSGWIADYPDPQNFVDILFHSGSEENTGDYRNPSLDTLLEKAAVERDIAKRVEMYQQVEQRLIDDGAVIPLWYSRVHILVKPYVKGYVITPLGIPIFRGVTLGPH